MQLVWGQQDVLRSGHRRLRRWQTLATPTQAKPILTLEWETRPRPKSVISKLDECASVRFDPVLPYWALQPQNTRWEPLCATKTICTDEWNFVSIQEQLVRVKADGKKWKAWRLDHMDIAKAMREARRDEERNEDRRAATAREANWAAAERKENANWQDAETPEQVKRRVEREEQKKIDAKREASRREEELRDGYVPPMTVRVKETSGLLWIESESQDNPTDVQKVVPSRKVTWCSQVVAADLATAQSLVPSPFSDKKFMRRVVRSSARPRRLRAADATAPRWSHFARVWSRTWRDMSHDIATQVSELLVDDENDDETLISQLPAGGVRVRLREQTRTIRLAILDVPHTKNKVHLYCIQCFVPVSKSTTRLMTGFWPEKSSKFAAVGRKAEARLRYLINKISHRPVLIPNGTPWGVPAPEWTDELFPMLDDALLEEDGSCHAQPEAALLQQSANGHAASSSGSDVGCRVAAQEGGVGDDAEMEAIRAALRFRGPGGSSLCESLPQPAPASEGEAAADCEETVSVASAEPPPCHSAHHISCASDFEPPANGSVHHASSAVDIEPRSNGAVCSSSSSTPVSPLEPGGSMSTVDLSNVPSSWVDAAADTERLSPSVLGYDGEEESEDDSVLPLPIRWVEDFQQEQLSAASAAAEASAAGAASAAPVEALVSTDALPVPATPASSGHEANADSCAPPLEQAVEDAGSAPSFYTPSDDRPALPPVQTNEETAAEGLVEKRNGADSVPVHNAAPTAAVELEVGQATSDSIDEEKMERLNSLLGVDPGVFHTVDADVPAGPVPQGLVAHSMWILLKRLHQAALSRRRAFALLRRMSFAGFFVVNLSTSIAAMGCSLIGITDPSATWLIAAVLYVSSWFLIGMSVALDFRAHRKESKLNRLLLCLHNEGSRIPGKRPRFSSLGRAKRFLFWLWLDWLRFWTGSKRTAVGPTKEPHHVR